MRTPEDGIRAALRAYEVRTSTSLNKHAKELGIGAAYLSDFLRGERGLGPRMIKAVRSHHPEMRDLLLDWLDTPNEEVAEVGVSRRAAV